MKTINQTLSLLLCLLLTVSVLSGCGGSPGAEGPSATEPAEGSAPDSGRTLSIVTTIFPEYDWVRQILGDQAENVELTMLLDSGVDLHSYQPTANDLLKISDCDLFLYVGGESDQWVEGALAQVTNPDQTVINLLDVLGDRVKEEEIVDGMEAEEEEEEGEEETEFDEHVWLSLKNAEALCSAIADALAALDPDHADAYSANARAYTDQLAALDAEYQAAVDAADKDTILFGDRFPFRYLADDYGLNYYAAFAGCSAETEASFETIVFLSDKVDELELSAILTIEGTDHRIAETIRDNTSSGNQEILAMDSLQSTTGQDVRDGITYLDAMTDNLSVLKTALR